MKNVAVVTERGTDRERDLAIRWGGVALALLTLRGFLYGFASTPSIYALFGIDDTDALGRAPAHTIQLEDLTLLVLALTAIAIAVLHAVRARRRDATSDTRSH